MSKIFGEKEFEEFHFKKIIQTPSMELPSLVQWYLEYKDLEYFVYEKVMKDKSLRQFFVVPPIMSGQFLKFQFF